MTKGTKNARQNIYKHRNNLKQRREREVTDEVADVEGVVISPESVVDRRIPPFVSSDYVVGGGDGGSDRGENEKDAAEEEVGWAWARHEGNVSF